MNHTSAGQSAAPTPKIAIASLVLGIASFVCLLGPIFGIPAIITGHLGYSRINKSHGALGGQGFALAGLILGYLNLAFCLVMIPLMVAIAIPNFVKARTTAQQIGCINNLRTLDAAKEQWAIENKAEPGAAPTEADLQPYLTGGTPVCPKGGVYSLDVIGENPTCTEEGHELGAIEF